MGERIHQRKTVAVGSVQIGGGRPLALIAGPCVIESERLVLETAEAIRRITEHVKVPFIFKSSYAKMNRMSRTSFSGPGIEDGLPILAKVRDEVGVPVLTDVHSPQDAARAAEVVDMLQIPAFLCRQTDLALAAGQTGKPVNVKKGQFLAPEDMGPISEKIASTGNTRILLTERGASFGYHNLVVDMRSLVILRRFGYPVVFDATHSVQLPAAGGSHSGGDAEFIPPLVRAAVATGVDALFVETHPCVSEALCDAKSMLPLEQLEDLLRQVVALEDGLQLKSSERLSEIDEGPISIEFEKNRANQVRLLMLDIDGTLTNGQLLFGQDGEMGKSFSVYDGMGINLALGKGIHVALVSGRTSEAAMKRAAELNVVDCQLGVPDKMHAYEKMMTKYGLRDEEIAYVGDDVDDIPIMQRTGFAVTVSTAIPSVKAEADYVTQAKGGYGAVREVVDLILSAQRKHGE